MYLFKFIRLPILIWVYFTKALEITWAKPMYLKYIFLCEGGMRLLITGFASIGYLHGKARLGELSFEFMFVCSL